MKRSLFFLLFICLYLQTDAQIGKTIDTAAIIKTYNKVLSFANKPFVYYTTISTMQASPVLASTDTIPITGVFYKAASDLYYKNGNEELYLQDSLLVKINHARKSILIAKVDDEAKEQLKNHNTNLKPLQEAIRKQFTITSAVLNNSVAKISLESKKQPLDKPISTHIELEYNPNNFMPISMTVAFKLAQPASVELLTMYKEQGIEIDRLLQNIDGQVYIIRSQIVKSHFNQIQANKEAVAEIPKWTQCLTYDVANNTFIPKITAMNDYDMSITF